MPIDIYRSQKRGGKGIIGTATREEDFVKQIFTASTHDMILFFTNRGKLYKLKDMKFLKLVEPQKEQQLLIY